jgi:hypothetical protein
MSSRRPLETSAKILGTIAAGSAVVLGAASWRWRSATAALVSRLRSDAARGPAASREASLDELPAPVARYFRAVLPAGGAPIRYARLEQRGSFLLRPRADGWRPFRAVEHFTTRPAGFVWDARIRAAPGVPVFVRDAFVGGRGAMTGSALGMYRVVSVEGTAELSASALQRYLAEAVWLPTALLPEDGVVWSPLDGSSARASLTVGPTSVSVEFHFRADGLVGRIYVPARGRDVGGGRLVPTPWQGHFSRYAVHGGYQIPTLGEVEWLLADGPQPYWRGEITRADFEPRSA